MVDIQQAVALVAPAVQRLCSNGEVLTGLILGSGLHDFANQLTDATVFSYADLPGFPQPSVEGHAGKLIVGLMAGKPVACLAGRVHFYEGSDLASLKVMLRTLKAVGCDQLIITNASGSINADIPPGGLVAITDHINFSFRNPLVGPAEADYPRFVPMDNAYDKESRERLQESAKALDIPLHEGVYIGVLGPSFETPAEIKAFRLLGADCVGMSTVADVLVARQCGLTVLTVSAVVNLAADLKSTSITHQETLEYGAKAAKKMIPLLSHYVEHAR